MQCFLRKSPPFENVFSGSNVSVIPIGSRKEDFGCATFGGGPLGVVNKVVSESLENLYLVVAVVPIAYTYIIQSSININLELIHEFYLRIKNFISKTDE